MVAPNLAWFRIAENGNVTENQIASGHSSDRYQWKQDDRLLFNFRQAHTVLRLDWDQE